MTDFDRACIRAYADTRMRGNAAAKKLYVARGTLDYHLNKIKGETGLDPRTFRGLVLLLEMVAE